MQRDTKNTAIVCHRGSSDTPSGCGCVGPNDSRWSPRQESYETRGDTKRQKEVSVFLAMSLNGVKKCQISSSNIVEVEGEGEGIETIA